ncbi:hypothetical protein GCM10009759_04040 [Kitasatospora saccharophila]|uniref:Uncharacterized protein n=1 Tax=Kitasatospora saccharophila TaxID=407973 RepID=A0ABP5HTF1_9ACTN
MVVVRKTGRCGRDRLDGVGRFCEARTGGQQIRVAGAKADGLPGKSVQVSELIDQHSAALTVS